MNPDEPGAAGPETAAPAPAEETPARRPTPSPTSRARRIGGRPATAPRPSASAPSASAPSASLPSGSAAPSERPVAMTKASPRATPPVVGESGAAGTPRRTSHGWPRWLPAAVLGVAAVALLVVIAVVTHGVYWAKPDDSAARRSEKQGQVLSAAKKCFAQINTYDYRKLDGLVDRDVACTTGTFTADLRSALKATIVPQAPKAKAVQTAQVNRAGVVSVSADGSQWTVLIYGQLLQSNSSTASKAPRTDLFGAVVTLDRVGDTYLISKVGYDTGNSLGG